MANVLFRRGTQEYINNNVPISDGQVVFNETDQAIYVDTPVNNVITRLRYGGGNLSRSDIDSALSDTSENPVQNKVITELVLQKTDIVNDYNTAVAVTATDIPVGCGVIKTANTKIGDLQSALNTTNGTVAQHTTDIEALNTGLATKTGSLVPDAISLNNYSEISVKQTGNVVNVQFILQNNGNVFLTGQFSPCSITGVALPRVALTLGNAYSSRDRWTYNHVCYAAMGDNGKIYVKVSTANELFVFVNFTYIV